MHYSRILTSALLAFLVGLPAARAQSAPGAAAEALFQEGREALQKGDLETACSRFKASYDLDAAVGTRLNLADCHERRGNVASAWEAFSAALEKLPPGDSRRAVAQARIKALSKRLPKLVVSLAPTAPKDTVVKEGDIVLGGDLLDIALPSDPGVHRLKVSATGRAARTFEVTLIEGKTATIVVEPGGPEGAVKEAPPAEPTQATAWPWVVGGAGVVGLLVGAVTGGIVLQKKSLTSTHCSDATRTCDAIGKAAEDAGHRLGPVSTTGFVIGALGIATSTVWLISRKQASTSAMIGVSPLGAGAAGRVEVVW